MWQLKQLDKEIEELRTKLADASRHESRPLKEQIMALERKRGYYDNKIAYFEDQIKKKNIQKAKLGEKTYKTAIKTTMLGRDAAKSEYWHFKDD